MVWRRKQQQHISSFLAREMVAALGAKGKALVLVMSKGLEHEPNEASKGRSSATNLRDVKVRSCPKIT